MTENREFIWSGLIVLSSRDSGRGQVKAKELIGMARVLSLWRVPDKPYTEVNVVYEILAQVFTLCTLHGQASTSLERNFTRTILKD